MCPGEESINKGRDERGIALLLTVVVIAFLSAIGGVMVNLSNEASSTIGNLRRVEQLKTCARSGLESQVAQFPNPLGSSQYNLTPELVARPTHYDTFTATGPSGGSYNYKNSSTVDPSSFQLAEQGTNVTNILAGGGDAGVGTGGGRKAFRVVSTCERTGTNAETSTARHESEAVMIYGLGR